MNALAVGGMEDHAHILLSLASSIAIARAMREIKSESSRCELRTLAGGLWGIFLTAADLVHFCALSG
jgi:REP element-mobilizing transposase RayT